MPEGGGEGEGEGATNEGDQGNESDDSKEEDEGLSCVTSNLPLSAVHT